MKHYIEILGFPVRDIVTGFTGTAASVCFDLYGCVQVVVTPEAKDGKLEDGRWFDYKRLSKTADVRVMEPPDFLRAVPAEAEPAREKGPENKSLPPSGPR